MEEKREQTNQTSAEKMRGVRKRSGAGGTPARRVARVAVLVALAMILSYVETLIPVNFGVPGIKLGLANLVVVTALAVLHPGEAFLISAIRILLVGLLFGNGASLLYSLAGGLLSFLVMLLLARTKAFSVYGVSVAGGVSHNIGQIAAAAALLGSRSIVWYLPVLMIAGILTGLLIGFLSARIARVLAHTQKETAG